MRKNYWVTFTFMKKTCEHVCMINVSRNFNLCENKSPSDIIESYSH